MRISLQPAFILHHRPYRETSLLLDVFTQDHGRVALIARGVRTSKSHLRALLQPFSPLLLSWQGKTELMTLMTAEAPRAPLFLTGNRLLSGFYLNELLLRLLQKHDPHPQLYTIYQETLLELGRAETPQKCLRLFEKKLLDELGYGLQLHHSVPDGKPLLADQFYRFQAEQGFILCANNGQANVFPGTSLLALAAECFDDAAVLRDIKRLMRMALGLLLGPKPLQSRELFNKNCRVD